MLKVLLFIMIWYANRLKESIFENYVEEIRIFDFLKAIINVLMRFRPV